MRCLWAGERLMIMMPLLLRRYAASMWRPALRLRSLELMVSSLGSLDWFVVQLTNLARPALPGEVNALKRNPPG